MVVTGDIATLPAPRSFCQSKPLLTYAFLALMLFTSNVNAATPSGPLNNDFLRSGLSTSPPLLQISTTTDSGPGCTA